MKIESISGFLEYTPCVERVRLRMLNAIRAAFELHGFTCIETPVVERVSSLVANSGDTDKEMYVLQRYQNAGDGKGEAELGMRYDHTVPLARYIAQHQNDLVFPFRRAAIGYVWRGERPQEGRFRQILQCDIDIVARDLLPIQADAEIAEVAYRVLDLLDIGAFEMRISNRKILQGYLEGLRISAITEVIRVLDKLDKIGREGVLATLKGEGGLSAEIAEKALELAAIKTDDGSFVDPRRRKCS